MADQTVTDFAELRRPPGVEHAWNEGDVAALEDVRRTANPYSGVDDVLAEAWDRGHCGLPLPDTGRHWGAVMSISTLRSVGSLRAQFNAEPWTPGQGCHRGDREAAPEEVAA